MLKLSVGVNHLCVFLLLQVEKEIMAYKRQGSKFKDLFIREWNYLTSPAF